MAKIKDRLIFESKKIEAVEQRKLSKEQKSRVKEAQAHRLAEKAQAKKNHMKEVESWARTAAMNRPGGGKVFDEDEDRQYFDQMAGGPNKKRLAKDKKYGFGGKRARFKQTSKKSINDMSDYNPRGNFGGLGAKKSRPVKTKRIGKRARDAAKARR
jgi:rRNA-processing protein EBP2